METIEEHHADTFFLGHNAVYVAAKHGCEQMREYFEADDCPVPPYLANGEQCVLARLKPTCAMIRFYADKLIA